MKKKLITLLCLTLALSAFLSVAAFAAPTKIGENYNIGNTDALMTVKKPASLKATTSERTYTVTAAGKPGIDVTVYRKMDVSALVYFQYLYTMLIIYGTGILIVPVIKTEYHRHLVGRHIITVEPVLHHKGKYISIFH